MNRIYKKKYGEDLVKGYDILTLDAVEKGKVEQYTKVPHSWDKIPNSTLRISQIGHGNDSSIIPYKARESTN